MRSILVGIAAFASISIVASETYRLAIFPQTLDQADVTCGLDDVQQSALYLTIEPTAVCTYHPGLITVYPESRAYYSFTNSSSKQCLQFACDSTCTECYARQGNCTTHHGSGSGSGQSTLAPVEMAGVSADVLTCGTSVTGRTDVSPVNIIGNDSPDKVFTLQVPQSGTVHFDSCASGFHAMVRVYDLEGEELASCEKCADCSMDLVEGSYAIFVEGVDASESGRFDIWMSCGREKRTVDSPSTPATLNRCYNSLNQDFTVAFFLFHESELMYDHGVCVLETPDQRPASNRPVVLSWLNSTCNQTFSPATVVATVVNYSVCSVMWGDDPSNDGEFSSALVTDGNGTIGAKLNCNPECNVCQTEATIEQGQDKCWGSRYKVVQSKSFNTCGVINDETTTAQSTQSTGSTATATVVPHEGTTAAPHKNQDGSHGSSPVGAIVGSLIGAMVVGGAVFFVIRRRKLARMNAYAALQDDPAF